MRGWVWGLRGAWLVLFLGVTFVVGRPHAGRQGPYISALAAVGPSEVRAQECPNEFCLNATDPCTGSELGLFCSIQSGICTTKTCP